MDDMKTITIKDVAREAEVSTATVSRTLNENYPVSKETKKRVYEAIRKLNYSPNAIARSLKRNKTKLVGFVVGDISNPFFMQIARVIEDEMRSRGYNMIMAVTHEDEKLEKKLLKTLLEKRVDSVVIAPCGNSSKEISKLIKNNIDIVVIDRKIEGLNVDIVIEDNVSSSFKLIEHIIKKGHRKIAIVNGKMNVSTGVDRFLGFKAAMAHYNIDIIDEYVLYGEFRTKKSYEEVKRLLSNNSIENPTAIFAANNRIAEGVLMAIEEMALRIPDDISLVSYGEIGLAQLVEPKLTVLQQDPKTIGEIASRILIEKINGKLKGGFKEYIIYPEMYLGDSVKEM